MRSEIDLGDQQAAATNQKRRMVGQAPYVVNAGAVYTRSTGAASATLLFNRVGERIDAAGDSPLPDVITRSRNQLDFSVRFPIVGSDEVADVTGAGDTVIATFSLALAAGATFRDAARLANFAGGIVVMKERRRSQRIELPETSRAAA